MFLPAPRGLRDPVVHDQRRKMLGLAKMAPLREWAARITAETGHAIAEFDPADGGVDSRVILLNGVSRYPPARPGEETPMLSVDNDSDTAEFLWRARSESGLHQGSTLFWTVVPWNLADPAGVSRADVRDGSAYLLELLYLLPRLDTVILAGDLPKQAWAEFIAPLVDKFTVIETWDSIAALHGPPSAREELIAAFARAAKRVF